MKKYVSKDDVEKGLVDPKKPLTEQQQYLEKIQKEEQERHQQHGEKPHKETYKRKQRQNRPKYNWNRRNVTEETPVPDLPKKQVTKPDKQKFQQQLKDLRKQIDELNQKKENLYNEKKQLLKSTGETKQHSYNVKSKYSAILRQKHGIRKSIQQELNIIESKRDAAERELNTVNQKIKSLKNPQNFEDCSAQELQKRLEKIEHRLVTADLDKKEENRINMKIMQIKRAIISARSEAEVSSELAKLQDQNQILYKQVKEIRSAFGAKYHQLKAVKAQIGTINQQQSHEKVQPQEIRTPAEIIAEYDAKFEQIKKQKDEINQKMDKLRESYNKSYDDYEDYSDLVSYIKMVKEEKEKIKAHKEEEQKRKKQEQKRREKQKKQYEERLKKREERQKREEERKKQDEERRQKLKQEKEDYLNRNPNHDKMQLCKYLVEYCESLKPQNAYKKLQKRQQKAPQQITELNPAENKQWQKQLKKGAQVIVSKKLKQQDEAPKKVKPQKKKKQVPQNQNSIFTHHFDIVKQFQQVSILPPLNLPQIDQIIKQINQKVQVLSKPTEQQIQAYRARAQKQFDDMHGLGEERRGGHRGGHYKQKNGNGRQGEQREQRHEEHREKPKHRKYQSKQIVAGGQEFPDLN